MKRPKEKTPTVQPATLLTASHRTYLEVAGTNIEDVERALKAIGWPVACEQDKERQPEA